VTTREAACSCGQLRLEAAGDPVRISICNCLACQRRSGSVFGFQARFPAEQVRVTGTSTEYVRRSDEGEERVFRFCPDCGATVFYTTEDSPDLIAVPVGAFADPSFPQPMVSFYESRRHAWVGVPETIERGDLWATTLQPLYETGDYAEAADRGRELVEAHPGYAELLYNVACCESLAGRTADAVGHLERAIEASEPMRTRANVDSDFDPIRAEPAFRALVG
jgi:hypothetical protein